uniref:50S ribosomal protein L32 n=1 Tax=Handeliodendron bodinieri TaxID=290952 RepID=A0A7S8FIQ3_9ROSI|nr:50S ribosomal protein L32 [Handeliodendron bodinieri]QPD06642.1 50S ribosomal protein L32 [Handeliodendron bodinieri]
MFLFICRTKNFLNSRSKGISLTKKLSPLPNIPLFSKYFYEFVFLI